MTLLIVLLILLLACYSSFISFAGEEHLQRLRNLFGTAFFMFDPVTLKTKMAKEISPWPSKVIPLGLEPRTLTLKVLCSTS